ncbi:hypothetical protein [Chromobacterium subtsugae]|uniref:hypothetical protein n=1 Tax=Chromobacterium subtsugae TaxID=251747 RepID=UPI00128E6DCA|nr:hypothetical protein [Chromobacterium subtsugae]
MLVLLASGRAGEAASADRLDLARAARLQRLICRFLQLRRVAVAVGIADHTAGQARRGKKTCQ